MYKSKRILAMIPARGGSKGLPGKNIKPLLGRPLIGWTVAQARSSRLLDRIIADTDSPAIAAAAKRCGAEVPYLRPPGLAGDNARIIDVVLHSLDYFEKRGEKFDYFLLLEPTSPLRKPGDIDRAIKILVNAGGKGDSLVSVGRIALEHPAYAKKLAARGRVEPYCRGLLSAGNRQGLAPAYFPYGVVYLSSVKFIRRSGQVYGGRLLPMELERWQNYEINDIFDFRCVEAVMKEMKGRL